MNELAQLETALAPDVEAAAKAYRELIRAIASAERDIATIAEELSDCCEILDLSHETAVADADALREYASIQKRIRATKRKLPALQRERDEIDEKIAELKALGTGPGRKTTHGGVRKLLTEKHRLGQPWNDLRADEKRLAEIKGNARLFDQPEADDD